MNKDFIFLIVKLLGYMMLFACVFFYDQLKVGRQAKLIMLALGMGCLVLSGLVVGEH